MSLIEYDFSCKPCEGSGKAYVLTEKQSGGTYWKVVPCWHCQPESKLELEKLRGEK
jgi:hypothetical protein